MLDDASKSEARLSSLDGLLAAVIVSLLSLVYSTNLVPPYNRDVLVHAQLAHHLMKDGNLELTPAETPDNFQWSLRVDNTESPVRVLEWDESLCHLFRSGVLTPSENDYYVAKTVIPQVFVNTWGPGVSMITAPLFAGWDRFVRPFAENPADLWYVGKYVAGLFVALSGGLLYLTARSIACRFDSLLVSIMFGLGTAAWSVSSQNLWQHSVIELLLACGMLSFTRNGLGVAPIVCGVAYSWAVVCRPTMVMYAFAAGLSYLLRSRKGAICFALGALPAAVFFVCYSNLYFGSPFVFGQTPTDHPEVIAMSGKGSVWQTPIWYGALGNLISPSRGLWVFSPFLLFSIPGIVLAWRSDKYRSIRHLLFGIFFILLVQSRFVDWWGGFGFGNRYLVDTTPALCLYLVPVISFVRRSIGASLIFLILVGCAVSLQCMGVFIYDVNGWNARLGVGRPTPSQASPSFEAGTERLADLMLKHEDVQLAIMSIDEKQYRYRLWSLVDSQIAYYLFHPSVARKQRQTWQSVVDKTVNERLAQTHFEIGNVYHRLHHAELATKHLRLATQYEPKDIVLRVSLVLINPEHSLADMHATLESALGERDPYLFNRLGLVLLNSQPREAAWALERAIIVDPTISLSAFPQTVFLPLFEPAGTEEERLREATSFASMYRYTLAMWAAWQERRAGRIERALRLFEIASVAEPRQSCSILREVELYMQLQKWDKAKLSLEKAEKVGTSRIQQREVSEMRSAIESRLGPS